MHSYSTRKSSVWIEIYETNVLVQNYSLYKWRNVDRSDFDSMIRHFIANFHGLGLYSDSELYVIFNEFWCVLNYSTGYVFIHSVTTNISKPSNSCMICALFKFNLQYLTLYCLCSTLLDIGYFRHYQMCREIVVFRPQEHVC